MVCAKRYVMFGIWRHKNKSFDWTTVIIAVVIIMVIIVFHQVQCGLHKANRPFPSGEDQANKSLASTRSGLLGCRG